MNIILSTLERVLPGIQRATSALQFERRWMFGIVALQILAIFFEGIGIGFLLPILEYMRTEGDLAALPQQGGAWAFVAKMLGEVGLTANFGIVLLMTFIAIALRQIFVYLRGIYSNYVQYELIRRNRDVLFKNFLSASLDEQERSLSGNAVNDMTYEMERAIGAVRAGVELVALVITICGYLVVVFAMSFTLTVTAIFILALVGVVLFRLTSEVRDLGVRITGLNQTITAFLVERLTAARLVRLSGIEDAEMARFGSFTQHQRDASFRLQKLKTLFYALIEPITLFFAFILLYVSVESRLLPFEQIVLFFFILLRLTPIVRESMVQRQTYLGSFGSIDAVERRISALAAARESTNGTRVLGTVTSHIRFRNVSFSYDRGTTGPAIRQVDLTIPAGKMTALVGLSGSGKSTFVDLLPQLRVPQQGEILFDGTPHTDFSVQSLRRQIAFVPQAPQIFDSTVAEHIRIGRPDASDADVEEAARLAGAHGFISRLEHGYETRLGERGNRLSGGQKQRLDMARAIVRKASVLILDEPTSNLDAESEMVFRDTLARLRSHGDMTIIIIGHRLSTVANADQIVVMNAGRVEEIGTHAELMKSGGWYSRAVRSQSSDALVDGPAPAEATTS